jgi:hypothetical protein
LSGFVYIWLDSGKSKKQDNYRKFYIGCHWGSENDRYICSSNWMRDAYKRRPQDFKRRILARVSSKEELFKKEHYFLQMIKPEEIRNRYYNLHREEQKYFGYSNKGLKHGPCSEETKEKIRVATKGVKKTYTEESYQRLKDTLTGRKHTQEWKDANSKRMKAQWDSGERQGSKCSDETKAKMSAAQAGRQHYIPTEESRKAQSETRKALWSDPAYREKMTAIRKARPKKRG